jgi:hypothetical protein
MLPEGFERDSKSTEEDAKCLSGGAAGGAIDSNAQLLIESWNQLSDNSKQEILEIIKREKKQNHS